MESSVPPRDPVLLNDWHPVAIAGQLAAGAIAASQLLDLPIALWRDSAGGVHVWEDRCPHRGTAFSLGTVKGDSLRCAYHGWTFGAEGRCKHIPALPALGADALKARAATYAVKERYGLIWACLGTPDGEPPPFPEFGDAALRKIWCGPYDVLSSGPRIVENFLDMAHFAFVHEGILGAQDQAVIPDYTVERFHDPSYGGGVRAAGCRAWQPRASKAAEGGSDIEYSYRVVGPLAAILTKQAGAGPADAIALYAQPLAETTTRVWIVLALADAESSDDALREFQDTIFQQDRPILESQRPARLPLSPGAEVSVKCDRMSLAYRTYLKERGLRYGVLRDD
jgi:phenylpropionate dioxygenase-like ring-hydroxylating dioxygenase large terminal subunit